MEKIKQKNCQITLQKPARYAITTRDRISRREQILHTLARMLEAAPGEKITTARLATEVGVSEAALYRHFPSKAKMFEGLIDSIEDTLFSCITDIVGKEESTTATCQHVLTALILLCEQNPGFARILTGDALNGETGRLHARLVQLFERLETQLQEILQSTNAQGELQTSLPPPVAANMLLALFEGRISQFVRSRFRKKPSQDWNEQWQAIHQTIFYSKRPQ